MSPTFPSTPSLNLIHVALGDLVQVLEPDTRFWSGAGIASMLRPGEVVQCLGNDADGVLIARSDGSRMLVPAGTARNVGIHWFAEVSEELESDVDPSRESGVSDLAGDQRPQITMADETTFRRGAEEIPH